MSAVCWSQSSLSLTHAPCSPQVLRLEVFDHDALNLKEALTLQVWKSIGAAVGAKEFMGRAAVPLAPLIEEEGRDDETWYPLGRGEWTNLEGPGKGEGAVRLGLQYRAIEGFPSSEVRAGSGLCVQRCQGRA